MTAIFFTPGFSGRAPPSFFSRTMDFSATAFAMAWLSGWEVCFVLATSSGMASMA